MQTNAESVRRQAATRMQRDCNAKAMSQQTVCGVCGALTEGEGIEAPNKHRHHMNRKRVNFMVKLHSSKNWFKKNNRHNRLLNRGTQGFHYNRVFFFKPVKHDCGIIVFDDNWDDCVLGPYFRNKFKRSSSSKTESLS